MIRANEKTLLTTQDMDRLIDDGDMQQALHILT